MTRADLYVGRYQFRDDRRAVWRAIVEYIEKDVGRVDTVLELGAGFCDFSNLFPARTKIAIDVNPEMRAYAAPEVDFRVGDAVEIEGIEDASVDLVFASHFLEHLSPAEIARILRRARQVLRPGGKLVLLQPNFRLCPEHYFDDTSHRTALSDTELANHLVAAGFLPVRIVPDLLPFSMKSRLPKWYALVRAYLASPIRPMAAQMYFVATPTLSVDPDPGNPKTQGGGSHLAR